MGMATTFFFSAVLILAVVERPGRRFSGGISSVTTTLKSFASCVLVVDCVVAKPELRNTACEPISVTLPWNILPGTASMVTSASCPIRTLTRSEEHTSELQSLRHLVCRLLLEKKKKTRVWRILQKIQNNIHQDRHQPLN